MTATILILSLSASLISSPEHDAQLKSAIEEYEFGEHAAAKDKLVELLFPEIRLSNVEDVILARQYLGACHFILGDRDRAEAEFAKILAVDSAHQLDPEVFSPALVGFFEDVRKRTGLSLKKPPPPPPEKTVDPTPQPPPPPPFEEPPLALAFVPLGVGQFNNGDTGLGVVFAATEVALIATSISTFVMFKDLCQPTASNASECRVQPDDEGRADTLQTVALATFWGALGVTALGIVEAVISHPGDVPVALRAGPAPFTVRF